MGRRDAVQTVLEVVARCRVYLPQLLVTYEDGWMTRGNGTAANYDYGTVHHTASASSLARPFPTQAVLRNGRAGLSGPLCNFAGPACTVEAPRLHVTSANPANHAGASRASGPVPALSLFNPRTLGLEIDYAGSVPMLLGQMLVAQVWARAVADVLAGGNVEHVRAHQETSITGKWDPGYAPGRTIDMTAFRAAARNLSAGADLTPDQSNKLDNIYAAIFLGGPSTPYGASMLSLIDDLPRRTVNGVWLETVVHRTNPDGSPLDVPVLQELADAKSIGLTLQAELTATRAALAQVAAARGFDPAAVDSVVRNAVRGELADGTVHVEVSVAGPISIEQPDPAKALPAGSS